MPANIEIRQLAPDDHHRVLDFATSQWGADLMVVHGVQYYLSRLSGFCALCQGKMLGLVTYHLHGGECEIVSLDSLHEGQGIGSALVQAVIQVARDQTCRRLWLVTTNDNLNSLRFYQKRGFTLVAVRPNAVEVARRVKPEIPLVGNHGIPVRDEIELELTFEVS